MADEANPGALAGAAGVEKPIHATADGSSSIANKRVQRHHHETANEYTGFVVQLNDNWRVIACKDGIQWILQRRRGARGGQARWTGASYHRTRQSLIRVSHALCGRIDPAGMAALLTLQGRFEGVA